MKKKLLIIVLCLLSLTLIGCADVELDFFVYSVSDTRYRQLDVKLPTSLYQSLNGSESDKVENYLKDVSAAAGGYFSFQGASADTTNGNYTFLTFVQKLTGEQKAEEGLFESLNEVRSSNIFFAKSNVKLTNPFNLTAADNAFIGDIYDIMQNGRGEIRPFTEAFGLGAVDIGDIKTCLLLEKRGLNQKNNADDIVTVDGKKFYLYEGKLGAAADPDYTYKVPVTVGWFIVALLTGLIVAAVLLLVWRRRKEPGKEAKEMSKAEAYAAFMAANAPPPPPNVFGEYPDQKSDAGKDVFEDFPDDKK